MSCNHKNKPVISRNTSDRLLVNNEHKCNENDLSQLYKNLITVLKNKDLVVPFKENARNDEWENLTLHECQNFDETTSGKLEDSKHSKSLDLDTNNCDGLLKKRKSVETTRMGQFPEMGDNFEDNSNVIDFARLKEIFNTIDEAESNLEAHPHEDSTLEELRNDVTACGLANKSHENQNEDEAFNLGIRKFFETLKPEDKQHNIEEKTLLTNNSTTKRGKNKNIVLEQTVLPQENNINLINFGKSYEIFNFENEINDKKVSNENVTLRNLSSKLNIKTQLEEIFTSKEGESESINFGGLYELFDLFQETKNDDKQISTKNLSSNLDKRSLTKASGCEGNLEKLPENFNSNDTNQNSENIEFSTTELTLKESLNYVKKAICSAKDDLNLTNRVTFSKELGPSSIKRKRLTETAITSENELIDFGKLHKIFNVNEQETEISNKNLVLEFVDDTISRKELPQLNCSQEDDSQQLSEIFEFIDGNVAKDKEFTQTSRFLMDLFKETSKTSPLRDSSVKPTLNLDENVIFSDDRRNKNEHFIGGTDNSSTNINLKEGNQDDAVLAEEKSESFFTNCRTDIEPNKTSDDTATFNDSNTNFVKNFCSLLKNDNENVGPTQNDPKNLHEITDRLAETLGTDSSEFLNSNSWGRDTNSQNLEPNLESDENKNTATNELFNQIINTTMKSLNEDRGKTFNKDMKQSRKITFKRHRNGKFKIYRIRKEKKHYTGQELEDDGKIKNRQLIQLNSGSSVATDETKSDTLSTGSKELTQPQQELRKGINEVIKNSKLDCKDNSGVESVEVDKDDIKMKIQEVFLNVAQDLINNKQPSFKLRKQSFDNCVFKDGRLQLKALDKGVSTQVNYGLQKSRMKFCLMLHVLNKVKTLLETNTKLTKREIYYQIKNFINNQRATDRAINAVSCLLDVGPWSLNIVAQKGLVYGNLNIVLSSGENLNCNIPGTLIPQDINDIIEIRTLAYFILVIEKESIFHKLIEEDLPNKLTRPFIMITGKGFPDLNSQLFLKKLWTITALPTFILTDADPHGINIMLNYKFGSMRNAHVSNYLAVSNAKWLGVFPSEIVKFNITKQSLSEKDVNVAQRLLKTPYMQDNPRIAHELDVLLQKKHKAEIEGLMKNDTFLSDVYLTNKFYLQDFI